jgi:cbb3-type cytochrome oxidase subunit 3
MSSGIITGLAMLAFVAIVVWVFFFKRKEDFDEQANLPLDEDDKTEQDKEHRS